MFKSVTAPEPYEMDDGNVLVFLGGSIEMGAAEDWRTVVTKGMMDQPDVTILNPRRDDWDSSWVQDPTPGTMFHEQVTWELEAQEDADILVYYFDDNTKSPITLMELGMFAATHNRDKMVVVRCTDKFWKYGNVQIVCDKYDIPVVETMEELLSVLMDEPDDVDSDF